MPDQGSTLSKARLWRAPQSGTEAAEAAQRIPEIPFKLGQVYDLIPNRLAFVVVTGDTMTRSYIKRFPNLFFFSGDFQERYEPFCADFGPVNLSAVHGFCEYVREYFEHPALQSRSFIYYCNEDVNVRTNTAFLLAAYMMIEHGMTPQEAWAPLSRLSRGAFATFRDATFFEQDYHLTIEACLEGLHKGIECGWYDPETFNPSEYHYLDCPANADMHVLSPKFVGFKGPSDRQEDHSFTPTHYADVFLNKGVSAVVRLNEPTTYDPVGFTCEGIRHYDLYFDDCTTPDAAVVDRFLEICDAEKGMVAVHCKAGLGRTGTLIAVYFMKHFGWTASECIGWLRIVRPGSVIGPQQQFLHWAEGVYRKGCVRPQALPAFERTLSSDESEALGLQVAAAQKARAAKRGAMAGKIDLTRAGSNDSTSFGASGKGVLTRVGSNLSTRTFLSSFDEDLLRQEVDTGA